MRILIILIIFIILDGFLTAVYCSLRKRKASKKIEIHCEAEIGEKAQSNLKSEIRKYIEGYILYKSVFTQYIPSHRIRKFILKYQFKMNIHKSAMIYHGGEFREPWNITIGAGSSIGDHARIDGRKKVEIGRNVNIGSGVWIWTEQHDYNDPDFECNGKGGIVKIGDRVWLSSRVTVLPKVLIQEGAVIAAGAVVTKDCDAFTLYAGCPAKKIGNRNSSLKYDLVGQYLHFY